MLLEQVRAHPSASDAGPGSSAGWVLALARLAVAATTALFVATAPLGVHGTWGRALALALVGVLAAVSIGQLVGVTRMGAGRIAPVALDTVAVLGLLWLSSPDPRYLFALVLFVQLEAAVTLGLRGGLVAWAATTSVYAVAEIAGQPEAWTLGAWAPVLMRVAVGLTIVLLVAQLLHAVRTQGRRLESLIAGADAVLWETDPNGRVTFVGGRARDILGHPADDWVGQVRPWMEHVPEQQREQVEATWQTLLDTGQSGRWEQEHVDENGHAVSLQGTARVATGSDDEHGGVTGVFVDVTPLKRAHERLLRSRRLHAFVAEANRMLLRTNARTDLFQHACRIAVERGGLAMAWVGLVEEGAVKPVASHGDTYGYLPVRITIGPNAHGRGMTGTAVREGRVYVCQDIATDPRMVPWRDRALARGLHASASFPLRVNDDVIGAFNVYAGQPNFFDSEDLELLTRLAENISFALSALANEAGRIEAEARLRSLNRELEARVADRTAELESAVHDLEAFAYSVSHDLRAPLRAVDGYSQILVEDHAELLDDEGTRVVDTIRASTQRMGELIDGLLAFSRAGRHTLQGRSIDIDALARSVTAELAPVYPTATVDIAPLGRAWGDQTLLRQVWANLISNALKFSATRQDPRVEIHREDVDGEARFVVRDNGVGFDPQYVDRLFAVFQRLHKTREFEGEGIGLAIVQRIVTRHGGRVWAEGKPDTGATFGFALPDRTDS